MDKVRFGIIGADFDLRANMVLVNYPKDRGELVALCDLNPAMFEKFKDHTAFYSPKSKRSSIDDPLEGPQYEVFQEHISRISHIMERIPFE